MKASTLGTLISNTIMVIVGLIWWLLFYCFGKIDVPMWIYKVALASFCIYVPIIIWAICIARKEISHEKKPTKKKQIKLYGS